MGNILFILSPPYSFSSIVSSMLGEHPKMYAFPETNLFVADTVAEMLQYHVKMKKILYLDGLLRTLSQLEFSIQTSETAEKARHWLQERQDWSTRQVWDYLVKYIHPKIPIEKTNFVTLKPEHIQRVSNNFPHAKFLHLTRHPETNSRSLLRVYSLGIPLPQVSSLQITDNAVRVWLAAHQNILKFTQSLPKHQMIQIRGEDILAKPDTYLQRIASWLGLETDSTAIAAMKHPERSPYAFVGPEEARLGNNIGFLESPALRVGKVSEPSLDDFLQHLSPQMRSPVRDMAQQLGY
jgi:hypothetical protein